MWQSVLPSDDPRSNKEPFLGVPATNDALVSIHGIARQRDQFISRPARLVLLLLPSVGRRLEASRVPPSPVRGFPPSQGYPLVYRLDPVPARIRCYRQTVWERRQA